MATVEKVPAGSLQPGMYVAELDRPWSESPFLFQGFTISSQEELAQLRECCEYVYVENTSVAHGKQPGRTARKPHPPISGREPEPFSSEERRVAFQLVIEKAAQTRKRTRRYVNTLLNNVRFGLALETEVAKQVVEDMVVDITANPDTSLWLTQLKNMHEYTAEHCVNVAVLSIAFGAHLGFSQEDLHLVGLGALLHDVGKMRAPVELLDKNGPLTTDEYEIVKRHAVDGYRMMKATGNVPEASLDIIRYHHERIAGNGYPYGLRGGQISTAVRVVAMSDVYDAMTSDRAYRKGMLPDRALQLMHRLAPGGFGQELMQEFVRCIGVYPVGAVVELLGGDIGIVMRNDPLNRLRPVVMLVKQASGAGYFPRRYVSLATQDRLGGGRRWQVRRLLEPREAGIDLECIAMEEFLHVGQGADHSKPALQSSE